MTLCVILRFLYYIIIKLDAIFKSLMLFKLGEIELPSTTIINFLLSVNQSSFVWLILAQRERNIRNGPNDLHVFHLKPIAPSLVTFSFIGIDSTISHKSAIPDLIRHVFTSSV